VISVTLTAYGHNGVHSRRERLAVEKEIAPAVFSSPGSMKGDRHVDVPSMVVTVILFF
jgi:hypothetical protein